MAVEIEKKYRLPDERKQEFLNSLHEVGAEFQGEDLEENVIYGGGTLAKVGGALRIRKTQDQTLLTFKKRIPNSTGAKHQLEHETQISDAESLDLIIRELGMKPAVLYEKRRKKWNFRSVEIVLDELPFGWFIEIEGSLTAILEAEMRLGIDDLEVEHRTYPTLTRELGSTNGSITEARFTEHSIDHSRSGSDSGDPVSP